MIIQCDNCQKKYRIDPVKVNGRRVSFQCRQCGHKIQVSFQQGNKQSEAAVKSAAPQSPAPGGREDRSQHDTGKKRTAPGLSAANPASKRRFGLNAKMLLLFFVIPLCLVAISNGISLWKLQKLTDTIINDSYVMVERLSHNLVNDTAKMVADQCRLYLEAHPNLTRENFNNDPEFRQLALQKVGETGYTCIYSIPDQTGLSALWVHPNEKIIGIDLPSAMKKAMGPKYVSWMRIYKGAYNGKASSGYYKWKEKDGSIREKYMTCMPVKGTPYVVAATTYVDEIKRDAEKLKAKATSMVRRTETIMLILFGATLVLMGGIVLFYSRRLKSNLMALIDAAEKISIGDLDTEIKVRSKDEIKDLAETISRMQESIRLSIERLRRRR